MGLLLHAVVFMLGLAVVHDHRLRTDMRQPGTVRAAARLGYILTSLTMATALGSPLD